MIANDYLFLIFLIPTLFVIFRVDWSLRLAEPKKRLRVGAALLCIVFLILVVTSLLPRSLDNESGISPRDIAVMGISSVFGAALILSVKFTSVALFQILKRSRHPQGNSD